MTISMHTVRASIGVPGGENLEPKSGQMRLDMSWAPYVQGRLVLPLTGSALTEAIDPRNDVRARVLVQQTFGGSDTLASVSARFGGSAQALSEAFGGSVALISADGFTPWNVFGQRASTSRTFDLGIRRRTIQQSTAEIELELASDEALLQDFALVAAAEYMPGPTSVRALVGYVLGLIGAALEPGGADAQIDEQSSIWKPGVTAWDYLAPLVQQGQLRLWCDENRVWRLTSDETSTTGSVRLSATGTLVDASETIDRDGEWYDAVVIEYRWKDEAGLEQTVYDIATTDGYSKVKTISYDTAPPGPGAAKRVLRRSRGRGREFDLPAVSDYSVAPGQVATIVVEDTPTQTGLVSGVTWDWPADEMTVRTRDLVDTPDTAWLRSPAGRRWKDIPAGTAWTDYTLEGA